MFLTPRKGEVEAVTALLASGEYETPEAMARDIIKTVAQVLSERNTVGVHAYFPNTTEVTSDGAVVHFGGGLAIGPFYDRRDAEKCLKDAQEAGMSARTAPLRGTGAIKPAEALEGVFCDCGHRKELHPKSDRCKVLPTCPCKGFTTKGN